MAVAFIYEQDADEELMLKACDGDEKAFNVLYARHKNRLYRYVRYQCGDPTTVHDIFQEVWENLFKACKRYTVQAKFITYLFKVAHNRVIDYYRWLFSRLSISNNSHEEDSPDLEDLPNSEQLGPEMIAYLEERKNATLEMLGELPLVQREAFLLFVEGMTLEEIAEATGVNEETVKSRIRYARNKLKQLSREQM